MGGGSGYTSFAMAPRILSYLVMISVVINLFPPLVSAAEQEGAKESPYLGVKFYRLTTQEGSWPKKILPEYLGQAIWQDGALQSKIIDQGLQELMNQPYYPQRATQSLKPGTREHLSAIASEGWQFGVISQITGNPEK